MKKVLTLAVVAVLALSLVACGGGKIKDGTYTAENKNPANGWADTLSLTYKDGVVVEAKYDAKGEDGSLKSETPDENYPMDPVLSVWMPQLNENIAKAGSADKIEAIAGATSSSNAAKALYAEVEKKAKAGDTSVAIVDNKVEG